jgi:hypothetical protein
MADSSEHDELEEIEDEVQERERAKLDVGDDRPQDRDIRPRERRQGEGLDVGDPHPADRDR